MKSIVDLFQIKHPLIQAPMAGGITTTELVVEVANNGALGMIGAGYMNAVALRRQINEIKQQTTALFGVNLFIPGKLGTNNEKIETSKKILQAYYKDYGIQENDITLPTEDSLKENYEQQLDTILQENISICSFTFGVPDETTIEKLQAHQVKVIGTATTVKEAMLIKKLGMDAVVLQGSEAGGHRSAFLEDVLDSQMGLMSLIPQVVDRVEIPVIAAGGIMDKRGVNAAFCLGADAVQLGTAFLLTEESGAHYLHKQRISQTSGDDAVLTKAFSGKYARGIRNKFITDMKRLDKEISEYPIQNALTQPLRKEAKSENNDDLMSLWSGQSAGLGKIQTVKELIQSILKDEKVD